MNTVDGRIKPVSIEDVTDYHPTQGAVPSKRVNYEMQDGTKSYVLIPRHSYSVDSVARALNDAADTHEQVMQLRGHPVTPDFSQSDPWEQE